LLPQGIPELRSRFVRVCHGISRSMLFCARCNANFGHCFQRDFIEARMAMLSFTSRVRFTPPNAGVCGITRRISLMHTVGDLLIEPLSTTQTQTISNYRQRAHSRMRSSTEHAEYCSHYHMQLRVLFRYNNNIYIFIFAFTKPNSFHFVLVWGHTYRRPLWGNTLRH